MTAGKGQSDPSPERSSLIDDKGQGQMDSLRSVGLGEQGQMETIGGESLGEPGWMVDLYLSLYCFDSSS